MSAPSLRRLLDFNFVNAKKRRVCRWNPRIELLETRQLLAVSVLGGDQMQDNLFCEAVAVSEFPLVDAIAPSSLSSQSSNLMLSSDLILSSDDFVAPTIAAPTIAGSTWPAVFRDFVSGGSGQGMELVEGAAPLAFNDMDRLVLPFSEAMASIEASSFELRNSVTTIPFNLVYDASTFVVTLELSTPLPAGKYRLSVSDAVTDIAGNALDGDADGQAGGVFSVRFDVLPGDTDGNMRVTSNDLAPFSAAFNGSIGQSNYNLRSDWNADGIVNNDDLAAFPSLINQRIDNLPEPASPFSAPSLAEASMGGSTWSSEFHNFLYGINGPGNEFLAGTKPVPFDDVDRLYVQFSTGMLNVVASHFELRDSAGVIPFNLVYDAATFLATLELASPLPAGKYRLSASDAITDTAGNALDGDGDGAAGGLYSIRFDVLPGDANGDMRVNTKDLIAFGAAFENQLGQTNYDVRYDWNADGRIDNVDADLLGMFYNQRIDRLADPGEPFTAARTSLKYSPMPVAADSGYDFLFEKLAEEDEDNWLG